MCITSNNHFKFSYPWHSSSNSCRSDTAHSPPTEYSPTSDNCLWNLSDNKRYRIILFNHNTHVSLYKVDILSKCYLGNYNATNIDCIQIQTDHLVFGNS